MPSANFGASFGVSNVIVPKNGPKAVPVTLDFSNDGEIDINCEMVISQGKIEYIQTLYIDNADNANPVTFVCSVTRQRVIVKARAQGYFPLLAPNPPVITVSTTQTANLIVSVFLLNVPVQAMNWQSQ